MNCSVNKTKKKILQDCSEAESLESKKNSLKYFNINFVDFKQKTPPVKVSVEKKNIKNIIDRKKQFFQKWNGQLVKKNEKPTLQAKDDKPVENNLSLKLKIQKKNPFLKNRFKIFKKIKQISKKKAQNLIFSPRDDFLKISENNMLFSLVEEKYARLHINRRFNNLLVTLTDLENNVLGSVSSGSVGFKKAKKLSPQAADAIGKKISFYAKLYNIVQVNLILKTLVTIYVHSIVRSVTLNGIEIMLIEDRIPHPHNGCRKKKARRI